MTQRDLHVNFPKSLRGPGLKEDAVDFASSENRNWCEHLEKTIWKTYEAFRTKSGKRAPLPSCNAHNATKDRSWLPEVPLVQTQP